MSIGAHTSTCVRIFCPWLINEGPPIHWYWRGFIHFCLAFTTQIKSLDMRMFLRLNFLIPKPVGILAANLEVQVKLVVFAVTCFAIEVWFAPMKKTAAQHLQSTSLHTALKDDLTHLLQWGFSLTSCTTSTSFLQCLTSFSRFSWQSSLDEGAS